MTATTMGYCTTGRRRLARKKHPACGGHCPPIQPGEVYLEVTEFPGGESGYADAAGHPVRMCVCAPCLIARDRQGALIDLDPIPFEQALRLGVW